MSHEPQVTHLCSWARDPQMWERAEPLASWPLGSWNMNTLLLNQEQPNEQDRVQVVDRGLSISEKGRLILKSHLPAFLQHVFTTVLLSTTHGSHWQIGDCQRSKQVRGGEENKDNFGKALSHHLIFPGNWKNTTMIPGAKYLIPGKHSCQNYYRNKTCSTQRPLLRCTVIM